MIEYTSRAVLDGRGFLEAPHWRDGQLWISDLHRHEVIAVDPATGATTVLLHFGDQPSGLGWLPDGSAIVVSLLDLVVRRVSDGSVYSDLSALTIGGTNDMVVDGNGRAYVGSFGFDVFGRAPKAPGNVVLVELDGSARVVADGLGFPNGMAITSGRQLLLAETFAKRILAYDIADDGSLGGQRVWADLPGRPDGVTLDAEGALWVALPREHRFVRAHEGGEISASIAARPGWEAISCGFGGEDRRDLYLAEADVSRTPAIAAVEVARVDVPGVG